MTSEQLDELEKQAVTSLKRWFECDAQTAINLINDARQRLRLRDSGIKTLDAKWLDPECHDGCQSLVLKNQISTLTAELEALRRDIMKHFRDMAELRESAKTNEKDKERLDWLAEKASVTFVHYVVSGYVIATSRDGKTKSHQMLSDDLRTALDAAMKEPK